MNACTFYIRRKPAPLLFLTLSELYPSLPSSLPPSLQLLDLYGEDARVYLLKCLVEATNVLQQQRQQQQQADPTTQQQQLFLLASELVAASRKPNFVSVLTQVRACASSLPPSLPPSPLNALVMKVKPLIFRNSSTLPPSLPPLLPRL